MSHRLNIIVIVIGLIILIGIIELVRRKKLNEEYSFLWLLLGFVLVFITIFPDLFYDFSFFIGSELPMNTLLFLGIILLLILSIFFSLKLSVLSNRIKNLTQMIALLEYEIKNMLSDKEKK
ncbi:MAG: DUF2304 domain-containing protein [Actinobacteria bacterium]|nr:DUF2304 domain-containing protein [Actinomycetota bacterium]